MINIKKVGKALLHMISILVVMTELVIILFLIVTKISGGVPSLFGHSVYVIVSPSMRPELEIGDVIISKTYDGGELKKDDVVQYVGKVGDAKGKIITHKIISIEGEGDDRTIVTKGTANSDPDAPISPDEVLSVMVYKTVVIDKIYHIIGTTAGFICLVVIPLAAMILCEILDLVKQIKEEKEGGGEDEVDGE